MFTEEIFKQIEKLHGEIENFSRTSFRVGEQPSEVDALQYKGRHSEVDIIKYNKQPSEVDAPYYKYQNSRSGYKVHFYKTESTASGSTTVYMTHQIIQSHSISVKYLCILYRNNSSYKCASCDKCCICCNKQLILIDNTLLITFNGSSIAPEFLFKDLRFPINIRVLLDTNISIFYGNVTAINRVCGGHGRVEFDADIVDNAGRYDSWSKKSLVKELIFYGEFPNGGYPYNGKKITLVNVPSDITIV